MLKSFIKDIKIHQFNCGTTEGALAGAVTGTSNPIDMSGYESICVVANVAKVVTSTSGANLYLSYCCSSGGTFHAIAGTAIQCGSSDTNLYLATDLVKILPDQRWIAPTVACPATCTWIGALTGYAYNGRNKPVTQPTCNYTDINISATSGTI